MAKKTPSMVRLRELVGQVAPQYLSQPNISSVGIGYKVSGKRGRRTNQLSVQFTVEKKFDLETAPQAIEAIGSVEIPRTFEVDGVEIPSDVLERSYSPTAQPVRLDAKLQNAAPRKSVINPVVPGVSIGHPDISAGTAGCVVYDANNAESLMLSNWHVLHGAQGQIGDPVVQPGRHDDNRVTQNEVGQLVRSHLGLAGDCAVARIDDRGVQDEILGLGVAVESIGEPELNDRVIKSGRTTAVTHGIVTRVHVRARINYGTAANPNVVEIGCFEIQPNPAKPARNGEISMGGDSGAAWMETRRGAATRMMVGLHFAGEVGDTREHALACYPASVFEKLEITPQPTPIARVVETRQGYSTGFLGGNVFLPKPMNASVRNDLLTVDNQTVVHYTHFSLAMSKERRLARWVAWNIDGKTIKRVSRDGVSFRLDRRLPNAAQIDNSLYRNNDLDRGHVARRADLCWGTMEEARRANEDSFFYTNIAPQHDEFNRSSADGLWGELENAVFEDVDVEDLKVSVMAGPVFDRCDPVHRGVSIPRAFWKAIYFRQAGQQTIRVRAFVLSQQDLVSQLEALELPEFAVFEVPVNELQELIGLDILNARRPRARRSGGESVSMDASAQSVRRVRSRAEILA